MKGFASVISILWAIPLKDAAGKDNENSRHSESCFREGIHKRLPYAYLLKHKLRAKVTDKTGAK